MKIFITAVVTALAVNQISIAHEGHDVTPGALKAVHGGTVKPGRQINLEYLVTAGTVKIYPVSHEGKDLLPTEVKLTATTKLPKGKAEVATLLMKDGAYSTVIDFKKSYRVEMDVTAEVAGKKDVFKFQVEK